MVLQRRTIAIAVAVFAVLALLIALLATASDDSSLGRLRANAGDGLEAVGDAITVPSATPTATPSSTPTLTPAQVAGQASIVRARALVVSITQLLAQGKREQAIIAANDQLNPELKKMAAGPEGDAVYADAQVLQAKLASASAAPSPSASPR